MSISAIVLAAGRSSRFEDGNKLLESVNGETVIRRVINEVAASSVEQIVVVVPADNAAIFREIGSSFWEIVSNTDNETTLSSSIRCGLKALNPGTTGALIVLGDMPGIDNELIDMIVKAFWDDGETRITFPLHSDGRRGHPVLWPASFFDQLQRLTGDRGGKHIIDAATACVLAVPFDGDGAFLDIDTRDDLRAFVTKVR